VRKWRQRFIEHRLEGLHDEARPGAPRKITDEQVQQVVVRTLESLSKNTTLWSTRSRTKATGLSQPAIVRIWHAFALQPHRTETFKLSSDPLFIGKVGNIVGLYLAPPQRAIVLSLDEKSQIQALDRTQPGLPLGLGYTEKHSHDYVRHGTTSLFSALNVATGQVIGRCLKRHRHQEFLRFLNTIDAAIPEEEGVTIHVIMDNYATHKTPALQRWFAKHPLYHVHFTPTSASWLNSAECFFSEITTKRIRRSTFRSVKQLVHSIEGYLVEHNANPKPFRWTATADEILTKVACVCKGISNSWH
jgi:transposase